MKKIILFFGIVAGFFITNAQTTDPVTVKVNLKHSQSISVNTNVIALDYNTPDQYLKGVESPQNNHLNVFSTGKYAIYFKANDASASSLLNTGATAIKITATLGTTGALSPLSFTSQGVMALKEVDQKLGSSATPGTGMINIIYKGAGDNAYVDKLGGGDKTLTTNVVYTILTE